MKSCLEGVLSANKMFYWKRQYSVFWYSTMSCLENSKIQLTFDVFIVFIGLNAVFEFPLIHFGRNTCGLLWCGLLQVNRQQFGDELI